MKPDAATGVRTQRETLGLAGLAAAVSLLLGFHHVVNQEVVHVQRDGRPRLHGIANHDPERCARLPEALDRAICPQPAEALAADASNGGDETPNNLLLPPLPAPQKALPQALSSQA
jgi:hypothetical protein